MFENYWINREFCLFKIQGDEPKFMQDTRIHKISWVDFKETTVVLVGPLPFVRELLRLETGDNIVILKREYGQMDLYESDLVVIKFDNCKVIQKWIEGIETYEQVEVYLQVTLQCEMEFLI